MHSSGKIQFNPLSIVGNLRDREVACSASDRRGSNFESCVWRTVSSHSSHHPQEVLLAQFSLYVHKGGLKPIHFISFISIQFNSVTSIAPKFSEMRAQRRRIDIETSSMSGVKA